MSQGNQSCLRFSLEESVWFQRGQEVAELVSISLDPNITIQENEQYVSIRGSLELTGEYTCQEQQEDNTDHIPALKYVHSVMEREAGVYEFLHRFPVDITIPKNRIESVYDIDISVESFDYVFPEKDRLKLNADLAITGLYGEQQHEAEQEDASFEPEELEISYREEEAPQAEAAQVGEEEKFDFPEIPAFSFVEQNEALKQEEEEASEEELYAPFRAEARKTGAEDAPAEQPELQEQRHWQALPEYSYSDFRKETPVAETEVEVETEVEEEAEVEVEVEMEQQPAAENVPAEVEVEEAVEVESSSSPVMKKKKPSMKQGISIAEFLARKEEEPEVAKIKVCIVQQGDSLQSISERYDIPVQQLLRVNHLGADHEVKEGQVLYVPRVAVHQL